MKRASSKRTCTAIRVPAKTFLYINIATWESAEAWDRIYGEYKPTEDNIPGVKGHPTTFEPVINVIY